MLRLRLTLLVCCFVLAGLGAQPGSAKPHREDRRDLGVHAAAYARKFIGIRYRYGGTSPSSGFDCSGFVAFVYHHFGVELPHYTFGQFERGRQVARGSLEPGDLVFFNGLSHVGLYVGRGRFIHAAHTGAGVRVERLSRAGQFAGARRVG